ncbi:MAG: hypothetical protein ACP5VE_15105 [Chthonomonadales bacterium]
MGAGVATRVRIVLEALADLMRGLFGLPNEAPAAGTDYAAEIEARYRHPRRCC